MLILLAAFGASGLSVSGPAAQAASGAPSDPYARVWRDCARQAVVEVPDPSARVRACYRDAALVAIEEQAQAATKAKSVTYYYYADGLPVALRSSASPVATAGGSGADAATVPVVIDWRATGEAVRAVSIEHFGEVRLPETRVTAARLRAVTLARAAESARIAVGHAPAPASAPGP
jgi:hypothetical protein